MSTDILIVGAGPTGVVLALELALQGVSFRIVDTAPTRSEISKALVVHPRSLELLNRHGISDELTAFKKNIKGVRLFVNKKTAVEFDLQDLGFNDTAYRSMFFISQAETEQFLDKTLKERYGKVVERGITAEKVEQDGAGVTVLLKDANGAEEQVRCKYVVGCDGAHSVVRRAANLKFEGASYPQDFMLADLHIKWNQLDERLTLFMGQGFMGCFPLGNDLYRLICTRPGGFEEKADPTLEDFKKHFAWLAPGNAELSDPTWMSRFRLHHRGVEKYRSGRIFIAGDAAHIHSPAGGQGMNSGMQDSINLGWKIGSVIRGEQDDSFLDTYHTERHKVGERVLRGTDRLFVFTTTANRVFLFIRNMLLPLIAPFVFSNPNRRARMFRFVSQLGIRYRNSPIVGTASTYVGPRRGGDRAPDGTLQLESGPTNFLRVCTGPKHHFIFFSGIGAEAVDATALHRVSKGFLDENNEMADLVQVHHVLSPLSKDERSSSDLIDMDGGLHASYGFTEPGYVLIRPDSYIAHIGSVSAMDELRDWVNNYWTSEDNDAETDDNPELVKES